MASILKVDALQGVTAAGSILVTGEGNSTTTNLQQGLAKTWVFLEGVDATLIGSLNVASSTDQGTGNHQINFSNNMSNATFAIANGHSRNNTGKAAYDECMTNDKASTHFEFWTAQTGSNSAQDNRIVDGIVMGDLA